MRTLRSTSILVLVVFLTAGLLYLSLGMAAEKPVQAGTGNSGLSFELAIGTTMSPQDPDGGCIASGETKTGRIFPGGDTDVYTFPGQAGQGVVITMADNSDTFYPRFEVYGPDGLRVADTGSALDVARSENLQLRKTGIYTIVASNLTGVYTGEYGLSLVLMPGATSSAQDPDGGDIASDETRMGTISPGGDLDIYAIYVQAGQGIRIQMADVSSTKALFPRLQLFDPNRVGIYDTGSASDVARIENLQLKKTGIYTIVASNSTGVFTGEYNLSLSLMPPKDPYGLYPYAPQPPDGNSISLPGTLSWWPVTGATGYDVYLGRGPCMPLEQVAENIAYPELAMPAVDGNEVCYWRVVAHTSGGDIQGPTWWFATIQRPCPDPIVIYDFPLATNPGWAVSGQWAFGRPAGRGGRDHGHPDPTRGHTGQNVFGVNLNGDYDAASGGPYSLTTGRVDLSQWKDVKLSFWRWLNTDSPEYVGSSVEISTDGTTWTPVWKHGGLTDITDSQWTAVEYDISAQADGRRNVYLRWTYGVLGKDAYPYSGWNLDDIQLIGKCRQ